MTKPDIYSLGEGNVFSCVCLFVHRGVPTSPLPIEPPTTWGPGNSPPPPPPHGPIQTCSLGTHPNHHHFHMKTPRPPPPPHIHTHYMDPCSNFFAWDLPPIHLSANRQAVLPPSTERLSCFCMCAVNCQFLR